MKKTLLTLVSVMSITCSFAQNTPWVTNGNIGIGTTTPQFPLDVAGAIRATGNITGFRINNKYIGNGINGDISSFAVGDNVLSGANNTGYGNMAVGSNVLNGDNISRFGNLGVGLSVLNSITLAYNNIGIGSNVLSQTTIGNENIGIGYQALRYNVTGYGSVGIGVNALIYSTAGRNTAVGYQAGASLTAGENNTFLGFYQSSAVTGNNNIILGGSYGNLGLTSGSSNTIIGSSLTNISPTLNNHIILADGWGQQRLVIDEGGKTGIGTTTPNAKLEVMGAMLSGSEYANLDPATGTTIGFLANTGECLIGWNRSGIEGETDFIANQGHGSNGGFAFYNYNNAGVQTELIKFKGGGNVGIGMTNPDEKLSVNGTVHSKEVKVDMNNWPDYVFKPSYDLMELNDVKAYVNENHHLPNIPSEAEVTKNGLKLGEMNSKLLQKVEELTLYMIGKDQQIKDQQVQINALKENQQAQISQQKAEIEALKQQFKSFINSNKKGE